MRIEARAVTSEADRGLDQVLRPPERWSAGRVWLPAWAGCAVLGLTNGVLRQTVYSKQLEELPAHQLSTAILLPALGGYTYLIDRRHPLPDRATAVRIGVGWAALTVIFEVGLGRLRGTPWSQVLADYDLSAGRIWSLVPVTMATAPILVESRHRHLPSEPPDSSRNR